MSEPFKSNAVKSPSLRDYLIDVNVCRNPHCENFGLSEDDIKDKRYSYRYVNKGNAPTMKCNRCGQRGKIYSNLSVLEAFHACLPLTIPYASCPNDECTLRHDNAFEYSSSSLKQTIKKPYYVNKEDSKKGVCQARCRACKQTYNLSEPLRLHIGDRRYWLKDMETFINAIVDGQGPSNIMNQQQVCADRYYSQLKAAANSLGDYNKFNVAKLMKQKYLHNEMNVYTDCLVTSIKMFRRDQRIQLEKVIVSVAECNQRSLVLAYHPLFHAHQFDHAKLSEDVLLPLEEQRYAYLKHPFHETDELPQLGLGGFLMEDFYAYMAHFLTLKKLLKQVRKVNFYMDGELALHSTATLAFADRIKDKRCDIFILKSDKKISMAQSAFNRSRKKAMDEYKKEFPNVKVSNDNQEIRRYLLDKERTRVNQAIKNTSIEKQLTIKKIMPSIFRNAIHKANSDAGKDYWITDELSNKNNPCTKILWITHDEKRMGTNKELTLLSNASLFYIDSFFNMIRARSATAQRPANTASGRRGLVKNVELPVVLIRNLTINVAFHNFFLKYRARNKNTVAYDHGLTTKKKPPLIKVAFNFKPDFKTAKRISEWLGT